MPLKLLLLSKNHLFYLANFVLDIVEQSLSFSFDLLVAKLLEFKAKVSSDVEPSL